MKMRLWPDGNRLRALVPAAIALLVVATVASRLHLLGSHELDWDEGVYWLSMQSMQAGHPIFTSVYSSQPPLFLLSTEPAWAFLGAGIAAARAVMLAWSAIAIVAGSVIGWRVGGRVAALAAAVTLAVDPLMVRQSLVLQADGPATALGLVAIALAAVAVTGHKRRWTTVCAGLAGALLVTGILTKLLDVALLPPLVAALASRAGWRRLLAAAIAGAVIAAAAILLPLHDSWQAMWNQAVGLHIDTRSSSSGISLTTALSLRWKLAALAVAGAVIGWRRHPRLVVTGVAWVVGGAAAMAITHPLWQHHAVAMSPGLALLCAAGVSAVFNWLSCRGGQRFVAAAAVVAVALFAGAALSLASGLGGLHPAADLQPLAASLARLTSPSAQLLGDEQYAQALAHRAVPPAFVDTSNTRLYAERDALHQLEATADGLPPVCAVLFSSGRLALLPGFAAWVAHRYPVRLDLGASRYLYVVQGCR
jgi:4-amino-4-deoxy-L-arabinose transferase-like glycosyltransferase